MKFHKTHIWLFVIVLVGVLMFGSTWAFAIESYCTPEQKALGTCLEIENKQGQVVYVVKAIVLDENGGIKDEEVNPGLNWPTDGAYSYWGSLADAEYYGGFRKPSAWSYIVFDLPYAPVDADPPGAQLPLGSFACGDATIDSNRIAYKLNPSVNTNNGAIFTLYFDVNGEGATYDPCSGTKVYVLFGKECSGGLLSPEDPYVQQRRFWCNDKVYIEVQYEKCTGIPYDQIKYYNLNVSPSPSDIGYEKDGAGNPAPPWVYAKVPAAPEVNNRIDRNFKVNNWGPAYGTLLCTDLDPVFVWKDRAYFCE